MCWVSGVCKALWKPKLKMPHNVSFCTVLITSCGLRHRDSQSHGDGLVTTTETHAKHHESQQLIMPPEKVTGRLGKYCKGQYLSPRLGVKMAFWVEESS